MLLCKRMIKIIVEIHINLKCIDLRNLFPVSALHCLKTVTWKDLIKKKKIHKNSQENVSLKQTLLGIQLLNSTLDLPNISGFYFDGLTSPCCLNMGQIVSRCVPGSSFRLAVMNTT